jgi:guanine nucleotide-binding protein G(i) subunit alpha
MGCKPSKEKEIRETIRSREIDLQIKQDCAQLRDQVKLLLLGAGESGKSTVLKQMKLIHEGGYTKEERDYYKEIIYSNTVQSMRVILEAMERMGIVLDRDKQKYCDVIYTLPMQIETDALPFLATEAIKILWKDRHVQEVYERRIEYQLNDSAK